MAQGPSLVATGLAYMLAGAYGGVILLAASGWGWIVCRVAGAERRDFAQRIALGLAAATIVGGVLEATHTIAPIALWVMLGVGIAGALPWLATSVRALRDPRPRPVGGQRPIAARALAAAVLALGTLQYCGAVSAGRHPGEVTAGNFNNHDDFHAYMVFPRKMLETGSQGADPFSERRLTSGLGGKSFLDTFVLAALGDRNLHLFDPGVGGIAFALGFLAWARGASVRREAALATVLLLVAVPPPTVNITAVTITAALYLALAREGSLLPESVLEPGSERTPTHVVLCAVLIAGLATLKTTAIVPAALLGALALATPRGSRGQRAARVAVGGLAAVALIVPWMVSLHRSSRTYLFPLLGRGVRGPAPDPTTLRLDLIDLAGTDPMSRRGLAVFAMVVIGWALATAAARHTAARRTSEGLFVACALASVAAMAVGLRGVDLYRHAYAVVFPTLMVMVARCASRAIERVEARDAAEHPARDRETAGLAIAGAGVLAMLALFAHDAAVRHRDALRAIAFGATGGMLDTPQERAAIRRVQAALPEGATVLARLTRPYLLDFARNRVLINDWPGGASPPPGLPAFQGAEALAAYLTRLGIRYLAYSYADEAGYPEASVAERLKPSTPEWIRNQTRYALDFQGAALALGASRHRVADDGATFVADLCSAPDGTLVAQAPVCAGPAR